MRSIRVRGLIAPSTTSSITAHRRHELFLGNGRRLSFNSSREARQHQAEVNRFLNDQLHELNELLGRAHADYRTAWPLFHADGQPLLPATERTVREALRAVDAALDRAVGAHAGPNSMHFAWKFLRDAADSLRATFEALAEVYRYKTQGALRHRVAMGARHAAEVAERLAAYGG